MPTTTSSVSLYFERIKKILSTDDATELTYRRPLQDLIESVGKGIGKTVVAANETKHIRGIGAPDIKVSHREIPLGRLETKDIGVNLTEMEQGKGESGDQFIRYSTEFDNWILTDYLEFRWFNHSELRETVRIAELVGKNTLRALPDAEQKLAGLLESFISCRSLTVRTAKELAVSLATSAKAMQRQTLNALRQDAEGGWLHEWFKAFQETLIQNLDEEKFSDMLAQTLAYGLFAARVNTPENEPFTRDSAARAIPKTNPFLRKFFAEVAGVDMPDTIAREMDGIIEVFCHTDIAAILKDFGTSEGKQDPVVHFYETFLAAYDPKMRKVRGVFFTPEPVVGYIVRSVDYLLINSFMRAKGLADEKTIILDPATGTGTFHYFVVDQIFQKFVAKKQDGMWSDYVDKFLLKKIFGFEFLAAPYAVAHLKLGMHLDKTTKCKLNTDQRLGIYLTNTLEHTAKQAELHFAKFLANEANAATAIKDAPTIEVVVGNPPYSKSMCESEWIMKLIAPYKEGLNEKKSDLNREEWKFLRFAQWRIETTGCGIVGFVINNTFLDALTHRQMRECLMETFTEIYILNLHGSVEKRNVALDGSKDENVFDIKQGVTIALFVKIPNVKGCRVFNNSDLRGTRESKYKQLQQTDISTTQWTELKPAKPNFFFVPQAAAMESASKEYEQGWKLADIASGISGIETKRDHFAIDFDKTTLEKRISDFVENDYSDLDRKERFKLRDNEWVVEKAVKELRKDASWKTNFVPCIHRPFDRKWIIYDDIILSRSRGGLMAAMNQPNLGLIAARQSKESFAVLASNCVCTHKIVTVYDRSFIFPLYIYPEKLENQGELVGGVGRRLNIAPAFLEAVAKKLKLPQMQPHGLPKGITPEDIFNYAYAVFYSPTYRARYAEFLKIDFPRLPLTSDLSLFRTLAAKGSELVALHLMESPRLENVSLEFPVKGDNKIEKVRYTENDQRVWINAKQFLSGVPKSVWDFNVGGYRVCDRWLKDREGRQFSCEDIQHYQKIVAALNETIRLMSEINAAIPAWPMA